MKKAIILFLCGLLFCFSGIRTSQAQKVAIPNFWDKHERFTKPDLTLMPRFRFLTTTDFPPFNFIDRQNQLVGFHVDLAREVCRELDILNRCEIQAIPWDQLSDAIERGQGEAIIAGIEVTKESRQKYNFSRPFLKIPARFIARKDSKLFTPVFEGLFRKKTGVVKGSVHAKYFADIFNERKFEEFLTREAALKALIEKKIDAVFSDAVSLAFWLSSNEAKECCEFVDGPFMSEDYFGNGLTIALPKDKQQLVEGIQYALAKINENGKFAEIYLKYFPISLY